MIRSGVGRALCIGVDATDAPIRPDGAAGAEADALALSTIAACHGFQTPKVLLGADATHDQVYFQLREAAALCQAGDLFLLAFSGHGGRQSTATASGPAELRGVWVLYDGSFEDAEMHSALAAFRRGVRVLVISDSCNGGVPGRSRQGAEASIQASVLVLTACQHDQYADTRGYPAHFTTALVGVWERDQSGGGSALDGYRGLHEALATQMPAYQRPNYYRLGLPDAGFEAQRPFTI